MRALLVVTLFVSALALWGCDASDSMTGSATVRVHLTDFPLDLIAEANVTIERIEMVREGSAPVLVATFEEPPVFNLMELRDGVSVLVAEAVIPGGTYNQLRVVVGADAEVVLVEDPDEPGPPRTFNLTVPSGTETGIKMNLPQITVETDGELIEITADFDVAESFVVQGNAATPAGIHGFIFKPVLKIAYLEVNGQVVVD